jgi:HEAT repeat protein
MHLFTMRHALFAILLGFLLTNSASAQFEGRFYLDKDTYQTGEPVYLYFDLTNNGTEPIGGMAGNIYSMCSGYRIEVSNDPSVDISSCSPVGIGGTCIVGGWSVAAGESLHEKILLNYEHDLSKAGIYSVRASRTLDYRPTAAVLANIQLSTEANIESSFHIVVRDGNLQNLVQTFEPYVADLHSKDEDRRGEAARAIGSLAPPFLEGAIVSMLDSAATRPFALIGLRHLNTSRSREALAKIVQGTSGYSYEKEQAIKYLSEMEDKRYFPLLLDEAKMQEPNQARDYALAASQLGGEDAMPYVTSLLGSTDPFSRANGIMALPLTGSRRAIPVLIDLLRSADVNVAQIASIGLIRLSHRSPYEPGHWFSNSPSDEYSDWISWWRLQKNDAPIYGPGQCGKIEPFK